LLGIGALTGILSGLLGGGGGTLTKPLVWGALEQAGVDPAVVVQVTFGTTLAMMVVTGTAAAIAHSRRGNVWWDVVRVMTPAGVGGAIAGSTAAAYIQGAVLKRAFGLFQILVALQMVCGPRRAGGRALEPIRAARWTVPAGVVIGFASAFFGIGGGGIAVPIMAVGLRFPMVAVAGTSGTLIAINSVAGTVGYAYNGWGNTRVPPFSLGFVNLVAFAILAVTGPACSTLGAALAPRLPTRALELTFAGTLLISGVTLAFF
jgi:uncharacterized membrane protein YfcA